jgi:hypothetical protein
MLHEPEVVLQGWRSELLWLSCLAEDESGQCSPKHFGIRARESKEVNNTKISLILVIRFLDQKKY